MSIISIFTKAQPSIQDVTFDGILEESTELTTEITEFPIESGSIGNDHAVQRPLILTMTVGISDNPARALAARTGALGSLASLGIGELTGGVVEEVGELAAAAGLGASLVNAAFAAGQASTRSQTALEAIRKLQRSNTIVDVVTAKRRYEECMIRNSFQQTTKENEQALELVIELQQMLIINSERKSREIPAPDDTAETQAQPITNLGQLTLQEP